MVKLETQIESFKIGRNESVWVSVGGLVGMLALNGIFSLVTQHGLEYPRFYERLYTLLQPSVFQVNITL